MVARAGPGLVPSSGGSNRAPAIPPGTHHPPRFGPTWPRTLPSSASKAQPVLLRPGHCSLSGCSTGATAFGEMEVSVPPDTGQNKNKKGLV